MSWCLREGAHLCSFPWSYFRSPFLSFSSHIPCHFLVIFPVRNLCQSQSHLLCPHPFHLLDHIPGHLSGHILNQCPFHFLFHFPRHFPSPNLCHILLRDITAHWLAYGHSRSTIIYAQTLLWVFKLPVVAGS